MVDDIVMTKKIRRQSWGLAVLGPLLAAFTISLVREPAIAGISPKNPITPNAGSVTGGIASPALKAPPAINIPTAVIPAPSCSTCSEKKTLEMHKKEEARIKDLLARNIAVQKKTPQGESVHQKLASNILTLNIMIDTVTIMINNIYSRCPGCKGGS